MPPVHNVLELGPYRGKSPGVYVQGSDWRIWAKRFENFLTLRDVKEDVQKRLIFLDEIGPENYGLLESLLPGQELETVEYKKLKDKMHERFKPKVLLLSERYRLLQLSQKTGQSLAEYHAELQNAAKTCELEKVQDVRDLLVSMAFLTGIQSAETRKRLMENSDHSATQLLEVAEAFERASRGAREARNGSPGEIHRVDQRSRGGGHPQRAAHAAVKSKRAGAPSGYIGKSGSQNRWSGRPDQTRGSPGWRGSATCFKCGKPGHKQQQCPQPDTPYTSKKTHQVMFEESEDSDWGGIFAIADNQDKSRPACRFEATLNGSPVTFELDTGAGMTVMGSQVWNSVGQPRLRTAETSATAYSGTPLRFKGICTMNVSWGGKTIPMDIHVMDCPAPALWGRDAIGKFKMDLNEVYHGVQGVRQVAKLDRAKEITRILKENEALFRPELGRCTTAKASLKFKEESPCPKFFRARPVAYSLKPKVDEALENMVLSGCIKRVDHATWATPLVVVPKADGRVRICGDFKVTVNQQLDIQQYPLPKPDDLFHMLNGGEKFSKIDLRDAYMQIELDEESKKYLVLNTQKGLYQYERLPFGVAPAPAIFQCIMEQTLAGIPGVLCYLDDVTVTAPNDEEHLLRLRKVLGRLKDSGFRLRRDKCAFMVESMEFLGHIVDKRGIRPSPEKVKAMVEMPPPSTIKQVESFIGMINYYGKFIPMLSTMAAPLNMLRKLGAEFKWGREQQIAFDKIKVCLTSADVLAHYDPRIPVVLATDASEYGIGAVIYHKYGDGNEKVIAYASRSLTKTERNYAQIEKEALGIVYGVEKFSQFLYGRQFTLLTDHQPLVRIFGPKHELPVIAAKRLHRWALKLMMYAFEIEYRRTEEFGNADGLSRLPQLAEMPSVDMLRMEDSITRWARHNLAILPVSREQWVVETERDPVLSKVREYLKHGFPAKVTDKDLKPYVTRKDELSREEGCLFWNGRAVIPAVLRLQVLKALHSNHYGKARMKALARLKVWFPGMDEQIEKLAKACEVCAVLGNQLTKTPLHPWELPDRPWQRVHIDFCGPVCNSMWLVVVDAKTKWPEVLKMSNITALSTIQKLRTVFATHGVPEQIVSDNGPQLTSKEFADFCKLLNVEHRFTPPYHPNSNGEAERFVQTFKKALEKCIRGGRKVEEAVDGLLLDYRSTPHPATGLSPAFMLMGRQLRTPLEAVTANTQEIENPEVTAKYRSQMRQNHDKTCRERSFKVGDSVYVQNPQPHGDRWFSGVITEKLGENRYNVHFGHGQRQCHANQLKGKAIRWEDYESYVLRKAGQDNSGSIPTATPFSKTLPSNPSPIPVINSPLKATQQASKRPAQQASQPAASKVSQQASQRAALTTKQPVMQKTAQQTSKNASQGAPSRQVPQRVQPQAPQQAAPATRASDRARKVPQRYHDQY